ncbi:lytic murein transglycosylase [Halalkalibaculum sp. DA384]|uniref:lytic murein transglycosylase n=1 Tax=Halalkalibaculum sp. DA384 TaxID=3373606 RepID=UPI003754606A
MGNILQATAGKTAIFILILFTGTASLGQGQALLSQNSSTAVLTVTEEQDSLSPLDKYDERLQTLVAYLKQQGYTIGSLLEDERFEIYEKIGDRFRNSAEKKSLGMEQYKRILGFEHKKRNITSFMETHTEQLQKAEETYGISKYVIAAIIGIESDFGKNFGSYNPFNSYVSMYLVDYRADFAQAQLKELLDFTTRNKLDVFELKSSYAGAMSYGQFIPYSINKWFVGSDIFDVNNNILSIANYLSYFKERTGSIETAVLRYNPSSLYRDAVLSLAREAEEMHTNTTRR